MFNYYFKLFPHLRILQNNYSYIVELLLGKNIRNTAAQQNSLWNLNTMFFRSLLLRLSTESLFRTESPLPITSLAVSEKELKCSETNIFQNKRKCFFLIFKGHNSVFIFYKRFRNFYKNIFNRLFVAQAITSELRIATRLFLFAKVRVL